MHLHAEQHHFDADIAGKGFGEWREQRSARMRGLPRRLVGAALGAVERQRGRGHDARAACVRARMVISMRLTWMRR